MELNCITGKKIVGLYLSILSDKRNVYVNEKIFFAHIVYFIMKFKHDFLQNQKIRWYIIIFGILWILLSVYNELIQDENISKFIFDLVIGLFVISRGLGVALERLFGKKFIYVDEEELIIKLKVLKKGIKLSWNEITSFELWPGKIIIKTQNEHILSADITQAAPQVRHDFLQTIIQTANSKRIDTNKHGYLKNL